MIPGAFLVCKDASLLANSSHLSGVLDRKDEKGTAIALVGAVQGQPMGVPMSGRDWRQLLNLCRKAGFIVLTFPVVDEDNPGAELHAVAGQITLVGQTEVGGTTSSVTLACGLTLPVARTGQQILDALRDEVRRVVEPAQKALAMRERDAGARVQ